MAKVVNPLLSIDATGSVGKSVTFSHWKGKNVAKYKIQRNGSMTPDQITVRQLLADITIAWRTGATVGGVVINAAYKLGFNTAAAGMQMSGFNLFVKRTVALNGGSAYDGSLAIPTSANA